MNPVAVPTLRPLGGFGPLFGWGLRRTLRAKKFVIGGVIGTAAVYGIGYLSRLGQDRVSALYHMLDVMLLGVVVPLSALGLVGGGFGEEVAEQTLAFHLVRPIRRSTLFIARFAAGLVPGAAVAAAMVVAACVANGAPIGAGAIASLALAAAIGVASLGAVYYALAALFRRGLVAGLVYTFFLEGIFQFLPGSMQKLSLTHHVRSIAHRWTDDAFASLSVAVRKVIERATQPAPERSVQQLFGTSIREPWSDVGTALLVCFVVGLAAMLFAGRAVERRDFALKD